MRPAIDRICVHIALPVHIALDATSLLPSSAAFRTSSFRFLFRSRSLHHNFGTDAILTVIIESARSNAIDTTRRKSCSASGDVSRRRLDHIRAAAGQHRRAAAAHAAGLWLHGAEVGGCDHHVVELQVPDCVISGRVEPQSGLLCVPTHSSAAAGRGPIEWFPASSVGMRWLRFSRAGP